MTEERIGLWEKNSFNNTGFIFKTQKFHGVPMFGFYDFSCNKPSGKYNFFTDEPWQMLCLDRVVLLDDVFEQDNGMAGA